MIAVVAAIQFFNQSVQVVELNMADTEARIVFAFTAKPTAVPKSTILVVWT